MSDAQHAAGRPHFREVPAQIDFPGLDARILDFWRTERIFEKSLTLRRDGPVFVFYEGPPTANGRPGVHHALSRVFKDIFPRYKTMRGFRVPRKAGWDCHGLPVELEVERRLGIDGKEQIEEYGVAEFNRRCRESVFTYLKDWDRLTERIGFWIDLDDAYRTLTNDYIESVWHLLRQIADKGLLYEGFKVVPYCPRCGTAISSHEVSQGYKDVTEPSIYVRFPLSAESAERLTGVPGTEVALAVWTTTPWTLVSNVAAAVHPEIDYALVESRGEWFVLAADLVETVLGGGAHVEKTFPGRLLLGCDYRAPFGFLTPEKRAHVVIAGDFVTTTDGTGIVHIAPAFGEDDMKVGLENGLPVLNAVDLQGRFIDVVTPWAGRFVKDADPLITEDLKARGLLLGVEPYEHSYPFCWRCDTPLLYYSKPTWYIRTTAVRDDLLAANEAVTWYPENIKHGRFGDWLANNIDWALGRDRYWGTPLPVWRCACGEWHCIGSVAELRELAETPPPDDLELHRPYIDEVTLRCPSCGGAMTRVPEVIDAWFDSGSMPFAQWHYPFENVETFRERFPADFIAEAIDQTRGWFYSLLAIATLIERRSSYKRVLCLGHILDADGQKMSKSRGNVVLPDTILDKQGADAFRWYLFTVSSPWYPRRFSEAAVDEVVRKFLLTLWNTYSFFTVYANIDRFDPSAEKVPPAERPLLDRWLLGELDRLIRVVTDGLEDYDVTNSGRAIQAFVDDLSNWYVRRSRRRFWKSSHDRDKLAAYQTLHECLVTVAKLLAPYTPFIAEEIYRNLVVEAAAGPSAGPGDMAAVDAAVPAGDQISTGAEAPAGRAAAPPESVHLCDWPQADPQAIDEDVLSSMAVARRVVELGRAARNAAAVKNRQPLAEVVVHVPATERQALLDLQDTVLDELNVKRLRAVDSEEELVGFRLKPNLRVLGPRLGKAVPQVAAALQAADARAAVSALRAGEHLSIGLDDGATVELAVDDVLVETEPLEGYRLEQDGGRTVALCVQIDDGLREEGLVRELIHAVQLARKNAGLRIEDTIDLDLDLPADLCDLAERHDSLIRSETLASSLSISGGGGRYREQVRVDGQDVGIGLTATGTIFTVTYG